MTVTGSPITSRSLSTEFLVITDTICCPPMSTTTSAMMLPRSTFFTVPLSWFRALSRDGPVRCRRYDSDRSEDSVIATRTNASAPRPTYPDLSADPGPARWATPELPNRRGSGPEDGGRRSFAEHAALQVCVAGIWTEPDREQRASEVLARHPAADRALRRHLHARVGAPGE